jgi:hypothetical protein
MATHTDYLFINSDFRILARVSSARYGTSDLHGRIVAGATSLNKALEMTAELMDKNPGMYTAGVRVSEGALDRARSMDKTRAAQLAAQQAVQDELIDEYAGYYGGF